MTVAMNFLMTILSQQSAQKGKRHMSDYHDSIILEMCKSNVTRIKVVKFDRNSHMMTVEYDIKDYDVNLSVFTAKTKSITINTVEFSYIITYHAASPVSECSLYCNRDMIYAMAVSLQPETTERTERYTKDKIDAS